MFSIVMIFFSHDRPFDVKCLEKCVSNKINAQHKAKDTHSFLNENSDARRQNLHPND